MNPWPVTQPGLGEVNMHQNDRWRKGMELILRRPWFRRIWILQEIANARVATVVCGKKSISARTFSQVPSLLELQLDPHCQAVLDIMPGISRKKSWWGHKRDLHTLLVKFRESEATDERDIIYALLGMSSDACKSDLLLPDYEKPLGQVIRDTTSFLLRYTNLDNKGLDWILLEFLLNLDSLSSAVLGIASEKGQETIVRILLATDRVQIDWKDNEQTPLQRAAWNGHEGIVFLLLEHGANLESKDRDDQTPLLLASINGHEGIVRLLLKHGANLESKNKDNQTPLLLASINGHEGIVRRLLEYGANLESEDRDNQTPLLVAFINGYEGIVQLLFEHGAKLESKDRDNRTPLLVAAQKGREPIVRLLLEKGVELESIDFLDRTPLSWAAQNGHEPVARLLLDQGAKPESKDWWNQTPLLLASMKEHWLLCGSC